MTRPIPNQVLMLRWIEPRGNGEAVQRRRFYTNPTTAAHRRNLLLGDPAMSGIQLFEAAVADRWRIVV